MGKKYIRGWKSFAILLSPALVIFSSLPVGLRAEPHPEWKVSLQFPVSGPIGQPEDGTVAGGTRRLSCFRENQENQEDQMFLTGLMPIGKQWWNKTKPIPFNQTLTVAANPTFFVYIPETTLPAEDLLEAKFIVYDEDTETEEHSTTYQIPTVGSSDVPSSSVSTAGIIKLSLPANVSLETGKNYRWTFVLKCTEPSGAMIDKLYVQGWIQRTELAPELKTKIEQATPLEQAKLYATSGIWSETLMLAAQLRSSHPDEWEELLKSVGLTEIAQAPFLECCTPEN